MALDTLTAQLLVSCQWQAAKKAVGADYSPTTNPSQINKRLTLSTGQANNTAGGANEVYSAIVSVAGASGLAVDLTSLTDVLGQTAVNLVRAKALLLRLLSTADDSGQGTNASSVTFNATAAPPSNLWPGKFATAVWNLQLRNGEVDCWFTPGAAGLAIDATHKIIYVTNNDATLAAKVQVTVVGADS